MRGDEYRGLAGSQVFLCRRVYLKIQATLTFMLSFLVPRQAPLVLILCSFESLLTLVHPDDMDGVGLPVQRYILCFFELLRRLLMATTFPDSKPKFIFSEKG